MPLRYPGFVADAGLDSHPREAAIYDELLHTFAQKAFRPTAAAVHPAEALQRRHTLGWIAPDMPERPLKLVSALVEFEVRGRSGPPVEPQLQPVKQHLETLLKIENASHYYGKAQRWVRHQLGRRPLEPTCLILPKHPEQVKHQPYKTGFHLSRPVFAPDVPPNTKWWDPCADGPGVPILCSVLRINDEIILILGIPGEVSPADRLRVACELSGISITESVTSPLVLQALPGQPSIIASGIAWVWYKLIDHHTVLTARPHIMERYHLGWNLAEMQVMDRDKPDLADVPALYEAFLALLPPSVFPAPTEHQVDKVFIATNKGKAHTLCELIRKAPREALPDQLRDNIVCFSETQRDSSMRDLIQLGVALQRWPTVEKGCVQHLATLAALACGIEPTSRLSLCAHALFAIASRQEVALLLPDTVFLKWHDDKQFCAVITTAAESVKICVYGGGFITEEHIRQKFHDLLALDTKHRLVLRFCGVPLDRSIAIFGGSALMQELEPDHTDESLLDVLVRLCSGFG